jgi:threonine dehydrogenase-like Zn-dependent dehydrogenase
VQKEIRLQGSIAYTSDDFGEAVALLSSGRAQADPLITHRHALDDVMDAFETQMSKDRSLKVLVTPGAPPSS